MPTDTEVLSALAPFFKEEQITGVLYTVKSGKEATVYCCEAHPSTGRDLLAAKVYRSLNDRTFRNDGVYREGRWIPSPNMRRAVRSKNKVGRGFEFATWLEHEYQTLKTLHAAGSDVPQPFARSGGAILMEYLGDRDGPAPMLRKVSLPPEEAEPAFEWVVENIATWLELNRVHADLSAYNILYWNGELKVIDFPQSVDPRLNQNAYQLLERDVRNVCKYWSRYGVHREPSLLAQDLWRRYGPL